MQSNSHRFVFLKRWSLAAPLLGLLAACQYAPPESRPLGPNAPPPPRIVDVAQKCNANDARFALGQKITPEVLEDARNRTDARTAATTKAGVIPSPADPQRLLVEVDAEGKMVGARCG